MELEVHNKLIKIGFKVQKNSMDFKISQTLLKRYVNLPEEYLTFLKSFERVTNTSDTVWFISNDDFNESTKNDFKWNEFELMSLEWSEDDDEELISIRKFWKNHIPILISVKDVYQFWAISLTDDSYGEIVHGQEPVFEETTKVCANFNDLIDLMENKEIKILSE